MLNKFLISRVVKLAQSRSGANLVKTGMIAPGFCALIVKHMNKKN